jgi:hypothetical protein
MLRHYILLSPEISILMPTPFVLHMGSSPHISSCQAGKLIIIILGCQVPSYVMLGISKHEEAPATPQRPLSPMGEACSRMDLTAIHQILVMTHYKDDEGTNEVIA